MKLIRVETTSNETHFIEAYPNDTIGDIKSALLSKKVTNSSSFQIEYRNIPLLDTDLIANIEGFNDNDVPSLTITQRKTLISKIADKSQQSTKKEPVQKPENYIHVVKTLNSLQLATSDEIEKEYLNNNYKLQDTIDALLKDNKVKQNIQTNMDNMKKRSSTNLQKLISEFPNLKPELVQHLFFSCSEKMPPTRAAIINLNKALHLEIINQQ